MVVRALILAPSPLPPPCLRVESFQARSGEVRQGPVAAEVRVAEAGDAVTEAVGQGEQQPVVRHPGVFERPPMTSDWLRWHFGLRPCDGSMDQKIGTHPIDGVHC